MLVRVELSSETLEHALQSIKIRARVASVRPVLGIIGRLNSTQSKLANQIIAIMLITKTIIKYNNILMKLSLEIIEVHIYVWLHSVNFHQQVVSQYIIITEYSIHINECTNERCKLSLYLLNLINIINNIIKIMILILSSSISSTTSWSLWFQHHYHQQLMNIMILRSSSLSSTHHQ